MNTAKKNTDLFTEEIMKKRTPFALIVTLLLAGIAVTTSADEVKPSSRFSFVIGPRVGVSYVFTNWDEYNSAIQQHFPDDRSYFPVVTQFGLNVEQRIRLGNTKSHFAFQEVLLIGGLDQNLFIPSFSTLIGFRSQKGLEIGLGPNVSMSMNDNGLSAALSVVYAVGWTFAFSDLYVPVNIAIIPTPRDGNPRITLVTGFNFGKQ